MDKFANQKENEIKGVSKEKSKLTTTTVSKLSVF